MKIYIPPDLYDELNRVATEKGVSAVELLRSYIRLGLLASYLEGNPDAALVLREGDTEREVIP